MLAATPSRSGAGTIVLEALRSPGSRQARYRGVNHRRPTVGPLADRALCQRAPCQGALCRGASRTTDPSGEPLVLPEPRVLPPRPHRRRRRRRRGSGRETRAGQGSSHYMDGSTWLRCSDSEGAGGPRACALPIVAVSITRDSDQLPRSIAVARGTYAILIMTTLVPRVKALT